MNLKSAQLLDHKYSLLQSLGQGAFGEVWLARDTVLGNHHVAIKFLTAANPDKDKDFLVEMRALAGLNLPGIVTFHHHFRHQKQLALVMEYCPDGSLSQRLRDKQPDDAGSWVNQVADWTLQLCDTLVAVHARGLVHHDIKPKNILLRDGKAVIADFGIVNTTGGTVIYSSPGKGLGLAHRDDAREDIYALGVTLLELLNRAHPWIKFTGDALETAKRQRTLPVELDQPTWLVEIALRAIHPEAELRFQTAADMATALRARSVPVSLDRSALRAHQAVLAGERALKRSDWRKAEQAAEVALQLSPRLPSAVLLAGRIKLLQHQTDAAYDILKDAAHGPSGNLMGLELGWLHLQRGELPMALSTLSDEVTRNPLNFEAHCLLLECYWTVRRFDEMKRLAEILRKEKCGNTAIDHAALLARLGLQELEPEWLQKQLALAKGSPFSIYNAQVVLAGPQALGGWDCLLDKLVFQDYRFGLPAALKATNTVVIEQQGNKVAFTDKLISIGKLAGNSLRIDAPSASRRHAVIVNVGNEVWLHDLHSTVGTWIDGIQVHGKHPLMGVHDVKIGGAPLRMWSREDLIA
ncbi:MAG: protein kinase domain-containing protein [Polaromonas sp.]